MAVCVIYNDADFYAIVQFQNVKYLKYISHPQNTFRVLKTIFFCQNSIK